MEFLNYPIFGNEISSWAIALATTLCTLVALQVMRSLLIRRVEHLAKRTQTQLDDAVVSALGKTKFLFLLALGIFVGLRFVALPDSARLVIRHALMVVTLFQVAIWGSSMLGFAVDQHMKQKLQSDAASATTIGLMTFLAKMVFYLLLLLLGLNNLGVNITALVAGLGVGGIAVALAVQNILGDLFASLTIILDKPFIVGDFIAVSADHMGTIEKIGMKTTRVRSLSGEQLIFSNADLLQSRIKNFKRMHERRVIFTLGVTYQTPAEKLQRAPDMVRAIIEAEPKARFERSHFFRFGASSLDIEVVYWVRNSEYNDYMDLHQRIHLAIFRKFQEEKIEFAYPSQTLFLKTEEPMEIRNGAAVLTQASPGSSAQQFS